jgi:hypothetical protein
VPALPSNNHYSVTGIGLDDLERRAYFLSHTMIDRICPVRSIESQPGDTVISFKLYIFKVQLRHFILPTMGV